MNRVHICLLLIAAALIIVTVYNNHKARGEIIDFVGDSSDSLASMLVFNQIQSRADKVIHLGDMTYGNPFQTYIDTYGTMFDGCVVGNHSPDTTKKYCGNSWNLKVGSILIIGLNTEGDYSNQLKNVTKWKSITGINTVIIATHRPLEKIETATYPTGLYDFAEDVKDIFPSAYYISGHKHISSFTTKYGEKMFIAGGGGASHEGCRQNIWKFCNDVDFGFLEIDTNTMALKFFDINGKMIYEVDSK